MSVTLTLVIATSLISLYAFSNPEKHRELMLSPYRVKHNNEWHRIISHAFVHKDYMHLLLNMFVLYQFGYQVVPGYESFGVEAKFEEDFGTQGRVYYVLLYVGAFLFAALPALRRHQENPLYFSLGASGAVSGVVFATMILYPTREMGLIFLPGTYLPSVVFGVLYMTYEIYMDKRGGSGIAHDAHIWGALFGIAFTIIIKFDYLREFIDQIKNLF